MRNSKIKVFLLTMLILLSFGSLFVFSTKNSVDTLQTSASTCLKGVEMESDTNTSNEFLTTGEAGGDIPFSIFASRYINDTYYITNYIPSFTATEPTTASDTYSYIMDEDSRPSFLLSSNGAEASHSDNYNTTIYFKFNDADGKTDTSNIIPNTGFLNLTASVNGTVIAVERDITNATTSDTSIIFAVNLHEVGISTCKCPSVDSNNLLGGNGIDNDISYRTGLYEFYFEYSYQDVYTGVSNKCLFTMSFYILDYSAYVENASPFTFENTNTFYVSNEGEIIDSDYEVYNYNYNNSPIVSFDATKFGLNFVYTAGYTKYPFVYDTFYYNYTPERIASLSLTDGANTGYVVIKQHNTDKTYNIQTYKNGVDNYIAKFDLKDFEQKFLIPNKVNTTFQGQYTFDLDFLAQNATTYTVIDKNMFSSIPDKISDQKLVLFGYELRYFDQDPNSTTYKQDVPLANEDTHTNFIAYNDSSSTELGGQFIDIPSYLAITDQAPLRFHSYGNLRSYTASFVMYDYKSTTENDVLQMFTDDNNNFEQGFTFSDNYISNVRTNTKLSSMPVTYYQGASISGDGIRVMELNYYVNLLVEIQPGNMEYKQLNGTQFVAFEVNNTVQSLYIQAIEDNTTYDFNTYTNKDVRINLAQEPNTFFAPVTVTYSYSSTYQRTNITSTGNLYLKTTSNNEDYSYTINNKKYDYFVTSQANDYSFTNSGYYRVYIRNSISSVPKNYSFIIDKTDFTNININRAVLNGTNYVKSASTLSSTLLSREDASDYIKYDLYVSNTAFTMSWREKPSGANSFCLVYYMDITDDTEHTENSLFKLANGQYWLTNGLKGTSFSSPIDNYQNSINIASDGTQTSFLSSNNYFNRDGFYFFYVHDEAGNYFTRIVLIETSLSSAIQGYWINSRGNIVDEGSENNLTWVPTYDPVNNPSNYVNKNTTIYFGTHKAISMPDLSTETKISIEDISFTRAYNLTDSGNLIAEKPMIKIGLYEDVLNHLKTYIRNTSSSPINVNDSSPNKESFAKAGYYLTLANTALSYIKTPTEINPATEEVVEPESRGTIREIYIAKIYTSGDPSNYNFNGEAYYDFRITNLNGVVALQSVCMNFDTVQGTFYAYGNDNGEEDEHLIRKNSATNLNILKFEYNKINDETAEYYSLSSLTYDYYEFILDDSSSAYTIKTSYPFATTASSIGIDLLEGQVLDQTGSKYMIDPINISPSGNTYAGKYILTRTYKGGDWEYSGSGSYDDENSFIYVGTGGSYYKNSDNKFINLFELDSLVRKYVVYVDHYGIITSTYMIREDRQQYIREVGDNISITLSNAYDDEWDFKEFFLTSSGTLTLDTNKIPILINIPLSKYFVYYNSINDSMYSKHSFAKLEISIFYCKSIYSEWLEYKIDGYDASNGYCTSSSLISAANPNGYLTFKAAGKYRIVINDGTGYSDSTLHTENANNLYPTTYTYSFEISHNAPTASAYTSTYNTQKSQFEQTLLTNDDGSQNFATNIKKENANSLDNNQVIIKWQDPTTPYTSKANQINIVVVDGRTRYNISIDMQTINLYQVAQSESKLVNLARVNNSSFIVYLKISFFEGRSTPSIFDFKEYYRYSYELSVDITKEYIYNITLSYISSSYNNQSYNDENGVSYAESMYKVSIDRTKPNLNINSLILLSSEEYLTNFYDTNTINNFKEENFDISNIEILPSIFTYTFGVSSSYRLTYNSADTMPYFFVRNYQKYNGQNISITPDMVDTVYDTAKAYYTDFSVFSTSYPRFSEVGLSNDIISVGSYDWHRITYNQGSTLKSLIATATNVTNPTGFYEIIEKDYAGNYRCYTIYFTEYATQANYLTLAIDGFDEQGYSKVDNTSDNNITASLRFEITELETKFGWGKLNIKNETLDTQFGVVDFTPFDSISYRNNLLNSLNEFFECNFDSRFSITLSKYNSNFPAVTRYINIITNESTAKLAAPTVEEIVNASTNTISYNLKFQAYTTKSVLYLESLKVNILQGTAWQNLYSYVGKDNVPERITGLTKGIYQAVYTDNYNKDNSYSYIVYVGEYYINNFGVEFNFEYSMYEYDFSQDTYYSGGNVDITYEGNIYVVWVNGVRYSGNENYEALSPSLGNYNCKTFTLKSNYSYTNIDANEKVGGTTYYEVVYRDITDNSIQKTYHISIFNELPSITLTNAYGTEVTSTLEESNSQITSSIVTINWGEITGCDFNELNDSADYEATTGILYTRNQNNEYRSGVALSKNQTISEEGYYKLQIRNKKLGNFRDIYFVISFGDFPLYTVYVGKNEINPSSDENLILTSTKEYDLVKATDSSTFDTIINVIVYAMANIDFNTSDFNALKSQLGFKNGYFDADTVGICNLSNIPHYYTTGTTNIIYNSNIELNILEFCFKNNILNKAYKRDDSAVNPTPQNVGNDYWTTIYLVYNLEGPIRIEFFAVTKVPRTTALLSGSLYYINDRTNTQGTILLNTNTTNFTLTNSQVKDGDVQIMWNKLATSNAYWYNKGNIIYTMDRYGVAKKYTTLEHTAITNDNREYLSSVLTGSGSHDLIFSDLAGNVHEFAASSYAPQTFYTICIIDSVIYYINYNEEDLNPIQQGVFNDSLNLIVDSQYTQYYSTINFLVTRNGSLYNGYTKDNNIYTFTESGRYVVQIAATYAKDETSLNTVNYNFIIVDSNSARLAYEFVEVPGYEITKIVRNNEDITQLFKDSNGKIKSLFISSNSTISGNGYYTITLKYGKDDEDILTYSFSINNYIPTISSNVAHGDTTTGSIVISYNPATIYEQLGECYIKVLTYNNDSKRFYEYAILTINENSFTDYSSKSFEITRSNSYFIQVETKSGNIISSFRVNKTDPLNSFAIIAIVIAVIVVIALVIVVIKLRTKMKVK